MQSTTELLIETKELKNAAWCFKALNHKLRQQILQLIHKKGRITVTDIFKTLKMEQSVASQHLAILRRQGFVTTERHARFIFYSVNYQRLKDIEGIAGQLLETKPPSTKGQVIPGPVTAAPTNKNETWFQTVSKRFSQV